MLPVSYAKRICCGRDFSDAADQPYPVFFFAVHQFCVFRQEICPPLLEQQHNRRTAQLKMSHFRTSRNAAVFLLNHDAANCYGTDFHLNNRPEIYGVQQVPFSAIEPVHRKHLAGGRLDTVQLAFYKMGLADSPVVNKYVVVLIRRCEPEHKAEPAAVFLFVCWILQQHIQSIPRSLD